MEGRNRLTALVTGAAGFVGSRVVEALQRKHRVVELDRHTRPGATDPILCDLRDPLPGNLPPKLDLLIHCAAVTGDEADADSESCVEVNLHGTASLLAYAGSAGVRTFVYLSTGSVYGMRGQPFHEDESLHPEGVYALSKAAGELLVRAHQDSMRTLILRLFYPYGPGQRPPRLIPRLIQRIEASRPIHLNDPTGSPKMNPLFIEDLIGWMGRLLQCDARGTYNLGGAEDVSVRQIALTLGSLMGRNVQLEAGNCATGNLIGDTSRIRNVTGFAPQWALKSGLSRVVDSWKREARERHTASARPSSE